MAKKIGILTGGGDCPGLNPAIRGCVYAAERMGYECIGFKDGWKGLIENSTMPLNRDLVREIILRGGTMLGTSRTHPYKREGGVDAVRDTFKKQDLHALVAMGGEDTLGVANKLYNDFKLPVVGVPKTMDNDLSGTDYTFGFNTSVTVALDALDRLRDTANSHHRVIVLEVMGRHSRLGVAFHRHSGRGGLCVHTGTPCAAGRTNLQDKGGLRKEKLRAGRSQRSRGPAHHRQGSGADQDDFGHVVLQGRCVGDKLANLIETHTALKPATP